MLRSVILAGLALASPLLAQTVHVVNGGTGLGLQNAVTAAASGDTILVHGGTFTTVHIAGKSLTMISEPARSTHVDSWTISALPSGGRCLVSGFEVANAPQPVTAELVLASCAGSVRFEDCVFRARTQSSTDAALISASPDVACVRCTFDGGSQQQPSSASNPTPPAGRAVRSVASQIALYDCVLRGGNGQFSNIDIGFNQIPAGDGAPAASIDATSTLFASNSSFTGGDGGPGHDLFCVHLIVCGIGPTPGGNAGAGVVVSAGGQLLEVAGSYTGGNGGTGGHGGDCCPGTPGSFPDAPAGVNAVPVSGASTLLGPTSAALEAPSAVRAGNVATLVVRGQPGSSVILALSLRTRWQLDLGFQGVFLYGPGVRRVPLGMIPGTGVLTASLPVSALPVGTLSVDRFLQIVVLDPASVVVLGSPAWMTILDPSF